jgi:hypothetical protein
VAFLIIGRHFDFFGYNGFFFIKACYLLKLKPLEDWKNVLSLIYCNFSKIGLLKSAILVHAAILDYFKNSSMTCSYLKVEQNVEEIFEKSRFLKI